MKRILADCFEIYDGGATLPRARVFSDYLRLKFGTMLGASSLELPVLGHSLHVLSREMAFELYREIIVAQIYAFPCSTSKPLIVDCGSNVGMSVLFFKALFPNARVIGVEPDPKTFEVLSGNVRRNHWNDVVLHNKAVGAADGTTNFYMNAQNPGDLGMSVIAQEHLKTQLTVPAARLSSIIGQDHVDFLKLDVEGAEEEVIDDLSQTSVIRQIDRMMVEYHHHIAGHAENLSHILDVLTKSGFGFQLKTLDLNFRRPEGFQVAWIYAYRKETVVN
jgi:FkbM family methyltransferase